MKQLVAVHIVMNIRRSSNGYDFLMLTNHTYLTVFLTFVFKILLSRTETSENEGLPVIVGLGPDMLIPIGQYVALQCDVRSIPKAAVEWVKDDRVITDSTDFVVKEYPQDEFTSSLILWIHKVTREHVGDYNCRAHNKYGSVVGRISIYGMQSANFAWKEIEVISQQRSNAGFIDFDWILTFFLTAIIAVVCKFE